MISVIIPLYNKEHCIKDTINSILMQSYKDFEIIVVNDGSKDDSVVVVESICDSRIRIIDKENEGVSKTRNRGIKEAKGDWVMFLDADDIMCEGCLQALIELGKQYPQANVLSGNFITRTEEKDIVSSTINENCLIPAPYKLIWMKKWNLRLGSFMASRELLPEFSADIAKGEDVLYCFNLLNNGIVASTYHPTMIYVRENSDLSKKILPIEMCLSWNIDFEGIDTYHRSIYIDILIKSIMFYIIKCHKLDYSYRLIKLHIKSLFLYTPIYLVRKFFQ